jgi:hypothetical protein
MTTVARPDCVETYLDKLKIPYFIISVEILQFINANKEQGNWESSITRFFDNFFKIDFNQSFNQPMVIYYREVITEEILELLHNYIKNQCGNIENIVFLTTQGVGLKRYYATFCQLHSTKGFNVIEVPWALGHEAFVLTEAEHLYQLPKKESIQSLFSYYGGTYELNPPERSIMTLFASRYADIAHVESAARPAEWQKVKNYLEYLSYFGDVNSINEYQSDYDRSVNNQSYIIPQLIKTDSYIYMEKFDRQGPQWQVDSKCFFSLIRETSCTQNFYNLSEKTIRCFFHGIAVLPTHGAHIIDDLQDMGFIINSKFVDYSYLKEENLFYRLQALGTQIDSIKQNLNFDDLYEQWVDNYDQFSYNCNYLLKNYKTQTILPRLDSYFK